jgi:hypothetical protein
MDGGPTVKSQPNKRKSLIANIQSRVNSGQYNVSQHFKKNQKNLLEKVKFFQKKEVAGGLPAYLVPRYQEAKDLLARVQALNPEGAAPLPAAPAPAPAPAPAAPAPAAPAPAAPSPLAPFTESSQEATFAAPAPLASAQTFKLKKGAAKSTRKAVGSPKATPYVPPAFNPPPANLPSRPLTFGNYNRSGNFHVRGTVAPTAPNASLEGASARPNNFLTFGAVRPPGESRVRTARAHKTAKKLRTMPQENMKYLEIASKEFLPLPELYDPFTGRKFDPEEDPQPEIDRAHDMLNDILDAAIRRAYTLKKRNLKRSTRTKPKAGV